MRWRKGFTMVELAVVIVITIILASIAMPRFMATVSSTKVETAAGQSARAMRFARQMAITTRGTTRVLAAADSSGVRVVNVAGDELYRFGFPGGARLSGSTGTPTFHARGTSVGSTLTVSDGSKSINVIVNAVGRVRIQRL